jgi:flavin-dependent dehydrogenase
MPAEPVSPIIYDAIIIGGGPGGSAAATYLSRAGKRVLVIEKERFPRFHIGESLLPYNHRLFREMGVLPKLEATCLIKKWGAQFHIGNGAKSLKLVFRRGKFTKEPAAFQVERSQFDKVLLDHARDCGAEVREGCAVTGYAVHPDRVVVEAKDGATHTFTGRFLIDASGRGNFTANIEGLREVHPHLKKLAVFGHFKGVRLDEGEARGDTVIIRLENKWFWIIPLTDEKTSVGCVMDTDEFAATKKSPQEIFDAVVQGSAVTRERMKMAALIGQMHTTSDFSYTNKRFVGRRLLRVGDAAGFMDPIFSAGVYLAMHSGKLAAEMVQQSLAAGDDGTRRFLKYERQVYRSMEFYWDMVEGYYTTPFMELFMEPRDKFSMPAAITALLAGEVEGGWRIRWRLRLFFFLVKLQKRFGIVPRLNFSESAAPSTPKVMWAEQEMAAK